MIEREKKYRWRQFSLKCVVLLVATISIFCGLLHIFVAKPRARGRDAVHTLLENGAHVYYFSGQATWDMPGVGGDDAGRVRSIILEGEHVDDSLMGKIAMCRNTESIELVGTSVTNDGMQMLSEMGNLKHLNVSISAVGDEGIRSIANIEGLTELWLFDSKVTDSGVSYLRGHSSLEVLGLECTKVTDISVDTLLEIPNLKRVNLIQTGVTSDGQRQLHEHGISSWNTTDETQE